MREIPLKLLESMLIKKQAKEASYDARRIFMFRREIGVLRLKNSLKTDHVCCHSLGGWLGAIPSALKMTTVRRFGDKLVTTFLGREPPAIA